MSQSRLHSFIEAWASTVIGFIMSMVLSAVVFPAFGHAFTLMQNFWITLIFTVASIIRTYMIRRWFNSFSGAKK